MTAKIVSRTTPARNPAFAARFSVLSSSSLFRSFRTHKDKDTRVSAPRRCCDCGFRGCADGPIGARRMGDNRPPPANLPQYKHEHRLGPRLLPPSGVFHDQPTTTRRFSCERRMEAKTHLLAVHHKNLGSYGAGAAGTGTGTTGASTTSSCSSRSSTFFICCGSSVSCDVSVVQHKTSKTGEWPSKRGGIVFGRASRSHKYESYFPKF